MSFEPQKFFIGLIDFFAIILPGALLTFLVKDRLGESLLGWNYGQLEGTSAWVVFLAASYLLGHFVFLIGAWLLDDFTYDPMRQASYGAQIKRLATGKQLSPALLRWLSRIFFGKELDLAVKHAVKIKEHYLGLDASNAVNAFQWSKAKLTLEHPAAIESVHRFEADSKFFRSLVIVCLLVITVLAPFKVVQMRRQFALFCIPVLILAFWRYVDQRLKATRQAYWYVITLESEREGTLPRHPSQANSDAPSHAGGVVYRKLKSGQVEYLLVQPKRSQRKKSSPEEWVLPKGHIEPGESMEETAVREVREEAGVWAEVKAELTTVTFSVKGKPITAKFYLMQAVDRGADVAISQMAFLLKRTIWWQAQDRRRRKWLGANEATRKATHPESIYLLRLAEESLQLIEAD